MKRLLIVLFSLVYSVNGAWADDVYYAVKYDSSISKNQVWSLNKTTGVETKLQDFAFPSGSWTASDSYFDTTTGKLFMKDGSGTKFVVYDSATDKFDENIDFNFSSYQKIFTTPESLNAIIKTGTDADGNATTVVGSGTIVGSDGKTIIGAKNDTDGNATTVVGASNIVDTEGKTIIETKSDGSVHIGENSLVTIEQNGKQSLYATDASGSAIPININNGSSLQINGVDVMDKINGTVALSSAMSALPNSSEDATSTCGMGTGFHKGLSAISAGCAMDFSTLTQNENLSPLFKRASVNLGTSAIMNSTGFSNFALRAGLTFKLGAKKSIGTDLSMDEDLQRFSTGTNTRIAELKKENDVLKNKVIHLETMQEELNAKLDALIASLNNG